MASLSNKLAANKKFEFSSEAFDADKFAVVNMTGFESISKPFRFMLTLVSDDAGIDFDKVLQNSATFRIFAPDGASSTPYHGVIAEFDQLQQTDGYVFYRAVLVPRLWHLSLYEMSEVYLNDQSIPQIIEKVLKGSRLTSADYELKLSGSYRERSFVCQYQETHLDFISRWMEKEGMYFFFDQDGQKEKIVIADNKSMHPSQAVKVLYRPVDQKDTGSSADSVQDFVCRQKPLPKQVVLRDYNHRKASVELKVTEPVFDNGIGEVNLYGENFRNEAEGQRYAKLRAEEILCGGKVFTGEATAVGLRSGYLMEMARHYRDNFNGKYLVTEVHHEGSQAAALLAGVKTSYSEGQGGETIYRNTFRAIPAAAQFRPERTTPRPRVSGTMNATIDAGGPSQYAELDEYGQYKVQLPFDNSDKDAGKGSARVRMASPYSGSDHGMNFPLHKDAEVLLSFIDGNPDEPVILGAVPNSENPSIVNQGNPFENRITTAGGNLVHMSDQSGKQVMWLHSPAGNSSVGLGATDGSGKPSIWTSTAGASESVTLGGSNGVFAGFKNSATLSMENSLSASLVNKLAIGASTGFSAGMDVVWKRGKGISIDDSDNWALKTSGKLFGSESIVMGGGQRMAVRAGIETAKQVTKVALGVNMAINAALAAQSALSLSKTTDEKGKADLWSSGAAVADARKWSIAGTAVSALAVATLVKVAASAVGTIGTREVAYASNIKIDDDGIKATVDDLPLLNKGSLVVKKNLVKLSTHSAASPIGSAIDVLSNEITLCANNLPAAESSLNLSATVAKLSTENPAGTVSLQHPAGGHVALASTGIVAESGTSKLNMTLAAGATLTGGPISKVSVLPAEVKSECGPSSSIGIVPSGVLISAPGGKVIVATAAGVMISGAVIRIG